MNKILLKNKKFIPTNNILKKILSGRWLQYQQIIQYLTSKNLYLKMYWYGPSSGWSPKFCIEKVTICGIYIAQNPLIGIIGISDKIINHLNNDKNLDPRARLLYKIAIKKGPLKWVETQLVTNNDLEVFLLLVDGKIKALSKEGILPMKSLSILIS